MTMRMTAAQDAGEDSGPKGRISQLMTKVESKLVWDKTGQPGVVMDAFHPSIQKAGEGNICEFEANLAYM